MKPTDAIRGKEWYIRRLIETYTAPLPQWPYPDGRLSAALPEAVARLSAVIVIMQLSLGRAV